MKPITGSLEKIASVLFEEFPDHKVSVERFPNSQDDEYLFEEENWNVNDYNAMLDKMVKDFDVHSIAFFYLKKGSQELSLTLKEIDRPSPVPAVKYCVAVLVSKLKPLIEALPVGTAPVSDLEQLKYLKNLESKKELTYKLLFI